MKIEVALLYEDHTWDTEVIETPMRGVDDTYEEAVVRWFEKVTHPMRMADDARYRKVVQACVYHIPEQDDDEEEE
jgi:hypothetical protein